MNAPQTLTDPRAAFRSAIAAAGITPPDVIEADGRLHRFSSSGRRGDEAGWYVLHGDGIPAGRYGCWRTGLDAIWRAGTGRALTPAESAEQRRRMEAARAQREAEETARHAAAREAAARLLAGAAPCADHPYLTAKRVGAHGVKVIAADHARRITPLVPALSGPLLLVPLRDAGGALHSVQCIDASGAKRFLAGGRVAGCYHPIGRPRGALLLAEGYATAATLHQATGHAVAVCFNCGNLLAVAQALRARFPRLCFVLCADNDALTPGNPGVSAAQTAARAVGGWLAVPNFREAAHG